MNLAFKDIQHNLGRFVLTAIGIGMLLMVVMGMGGIYRGIIEDATLLVDRVDADIWVVQRDTRGPFAELSRVPPTLVHRVASVPGVESSREFVYHTIQRERLGKPLRIAVLGLDWPNDRGEWLPLAEGRSLRQAHYEMVADRSLGMSMGEQVRLGKDDYTVVGVTESMISASGDGLAFFSIADSQAIQFDNPGEAVRLERAARRARGEAFEAAVGQPSLLENASRPTAELPGIARSQVSAVMVKLSPDARPEEVASIIEGWGDVSVFTSDGQKELLLRGTVEKARRQIGMFRVLLTAIAAIIMALILYTLTLDKIHSIALLKLIGASNVVILGLILQQALVLGAVGYVIAYTLGSQLFPHFPRRVILADADLVQLAMVVIGISVGSSLMGIWKALQVSPNEALV
ncbi:ABC transporter permease [Rhodopirellula sp. P2]|uniref:ABC transporter permease n=1 Tax=Rhodopirellula sp. P2 TaxID=2127060 RepID=UPI0023680705|nr:ABC transporter permease [Rhodopirellula sp. P2]WDQ17138.1 ABC transporter permease [Rhodopirellula sp. P2]